MEKTFFSLIALSFLFFTSCKNEKKTEGVEEIQVVEAPKPEAKKLEVHINPASDSGMVGHATFVEKDGKVSLSVMFEGLTPGEHAIHLHDVADCSAGDGTSAGGHWNPTGVDHGKWMEGQAHHAGDIGNFTADAEGKASLTFETDKWCIGCEDATKNIIGRGIIVHADADDFTSQPSGNAGARIGCGEIK